MSRWTLWCALLLATPVWAEGEEPAGESAPAEADESAKDEAGESAKDEAGESGKEGPEGAPGAEEPAPEEDEPPRGPPTSPDVFAEVLELIELPAAAVQARKSGVPEDEVKQIVGRAQGAEPAKTVREQLGKRRDEAKAGVKLGPKEGEAGEDHGKAGEDHGKAGEDHGKAGEDHGKAGEDHGKAGAPRATQAGSPAGEAEPAPRGGRGERRPADDDAAKPAEGKSAGRGGK